MPSIPALVDPAMLLWARQSANLVPVAAARKIGVPDDRIDEWESGASHPTIAQLRRAAQVYKRPLGVFFLPAPPQEFETMRDFRRVYGSIAASWSAELHEEFRRANSQREALLEIAELDGAELVGRWCPSELPENDSGMAAIARAMLIDGAPADFPNWGSDEYAHLNYWIGALEEAGVLVLHTARGLVETDEMRAFSLYFDEVPVVVLNGADWPRGRLFSLAHEYAHLLLRTAGLCDTTTDVRAATEDRQLEARCNAIAAEILMPADEVMRSEVVAARTSDHQWTLAELVHASKPFGVSVESFLRRLVTLGRVPVEFYRTFRDSQSDEVLRGNRSSGGNFYVTKARDLGRNYVRTVVDARERKVIDTITAAGFLDVKVDQIPKLASKVRR